ncbi:unnamed protein product [Arctogadus glacialis]
MKQGEPKANCSIFHRSVEAGSGPVIGPPAPGGRKRGRYPQAGALAPDTSRKTLRGGRQISSSRTLKPSGGPARRPLKGTCSHPRVKLPSGGTAHTLGTTLGKLFD